MPSEFVILKLFERDGDSFVALDGSESPFDIGFGIGSRTATLLQVIEDNRCGIDDLREIGTKLWDALRSGDVGPKLRERRSRAMAAGGLVQIRLEIPPSLEQLPWEALHDMEDGFLTGNPHYSVVRHIAKATPAAAPAAVDGIRVLVVIPEGARLDVEREWADIQHALGRMRGVSSLTRLDGSVTPDRLAEHLGRPRAYDVVHFIGHGRVHKERRDDVDVESVQIRLNDDTHADNWLDGNRFCAFFRRDPPPLVVLNCCLGGYPASGTTMSALGPGLQRAGVRAVVAMRYEIGDRMAIRFADQFYQSLVSRRQGRVDLAIEDARENLYVNGTDSTARAFMTPVLFLAEGSEQLFNVAPTPPPPSSKRPPPPVKRTQIPEGLVEALRAGRCVPVVGPAVLGGGATRRGLGPPGPFELARLLAKKGAFPEGDELDPASRPPEWLGPLLLPRVFQHAVATMRRFELIQFVREVYAVDAPPLLDPIARWRVPGYLYLHFDGLLERACDRANKAVRVVNGVDQSLAATPGNVPLLVHVRGTPSAYDSLVLTEQDHDELWDRMARIAPDVQRLVSGDLGRSVLFLGVSPRDALARRLATQLLTPTVMRTLGTCVFVSPKQSTVDAASWDRFNLTWVEAELDDFIPALDRAVAGVD